MVKTLALCSKTISDWEDQWQHYDGDAICRIIELLKDEVGIEVILKAILTRSILITPLYELPHRGTQMEMRAFNFFVRDDDLRRFRINCGGIELIKIVPIDELGFWTKLALGW